MSYMNQTNRLVEKVVEDLAAYFHEMAYLVEGDVPRYETYMDAADCLLDVRAMWGDDEEYFAARGAAAATLAVCE